MLFPRKNPCLSWPKLVSGGCELSSRPMRKEKRPDRTFSSTCLRELCLPINQQTVRKLHEFEYRRWVMGPCSRILGLPLQPSLPNDNALAPRHHALLTHMMLVLIIVSAWSKRLSVARSETVGILKIKFRWWWVASVPSSTEEFCRACRFMHNH